MKQRILIKLILLFLALALVVSGVQFFSSENFKKSVSNFFSFGQKTYAWCPEHPVDFEWLDTHISQKWKNASWPSIHNRFCRLTLEPIQNVDLAKITFKPLLKVQSADAKTAQLDWNPEFSVFQVNGLPFYSASLSREILDR